MATALEEKDASARGEGCLGKADVNEPVFILRGHDQLAPVAVRLWADLLFMLAQWYVNPSKGRMLRKVAQARQLAARMDAWHDRHIPGDGQ